jgi:hypothetical protein
MGTAHIHPNAAMRRFRVLTNEYRVVVSSLGVLANEDSPGWPFIHN